MKKIQATHIKTVNPTTSENVAAGYGLGQWWENTTTGDKFFHKTDGVWVLLGSSTVGFADITGDPSDNSALDSALNGKLEASNNLGDVADAGASRVSLKIDGRIAIGDANYDLITNYTKELVTSVAFTAPRTWKLSTITTPSEIIVVDEAGAISSTNSLTIIPQTGKKLNGVVNGTEVMESAYAHRRFFTDGSGNWFTDAGIVRMSKTQTLTNKAIVPRVVTVAYSSLTSGNLTPNLDTTDILEVTGISGTLNILNPTGTKINRMPLLFILKDDGTARSITTGTDYIPTANIHLPVTTIAGVECKYGVRVDGSTGKLVGELIDPIVTQITITTSTSITSDTTDAAGNRQANRNVIIDNGVNAINITINGTLSRPRTYLKHGTGAITFVQGSGRTLIQVDGTAVLSGAVGSTAALMSVGTTDYLRISNA